MDELRFYKPAEGRDVRDEHGRPLPACGKGLTWSGYWQRRLDDDDIVPTTREAVEAAEAALEAGLPAEAKPARRAKVETEQ